MKIEPRFNRKTTQKHAGVDKESRNFLVFDPLSEFLLTLFVNECLCIETRLKVNKNNEKVKLQSSDDCIDCFEFDLDNLSPTEVDPKCI